MGTTESDVTAIQLIKDWVEAQPYFEHCAEVEVFKYNREDNTGWILIHNRNVGVIEVDYVEVLSEHCHPEDQHGAKWTKVDVCDPQFFVKLSKLLKFWI